MASIRRAPLLASLCALGAVAGARADDPPRTGYGEELVVQGARSRSTVSAAPTSAATIVDAARFAGEAKTVAELVGTAPGVAVHEYGGLGQLATVSIRGSTADQVQVLLDGIPLNTAAGGGVDLSRIPRAWIDRIEVVRGAEGARYGAGALGGAVNIVTHPAAAGSWSAEATGGSFDTWSGSASGAIGGPRWGLLGAGALDQTGGRFPYLFDPTPALPGDPVEERTRTHNASLTAGGLVKGWWAVGSGRLDGVLVLTGGHRDLPGSPYRPTPSDGQRSTLATLTTRLAQPITDSVSLVASVGARDDHLSVWIAPQPGVRQRDVQLNAAAELLWTAGPSTASVRVGVAHEQLTADGAPDRSRDALAVTVSDDLLLAGRRLRISPALRWERQGPFDGASGSVGATWNVWGPLSARAGVARTFRVPSFAELYLTQGLVTPNPDLQPERSWSADAGISADGSLGLASVTLFSQSYTDLIVYEPDSFRRLKPFNDGKAEAQGIEVELASAPVGPLGIVASGAWTWLDARTLRGDEGVLGKQLPHRARHRVFARLAAGPAALNGHVEAHYVSEQYQDVRNSPGLRVPPTLTFNAGAAVRLLRAPDARLGLEIRNLLDDRSLQDGFGNPLPGRMVMVTLTLSGAKET